MSSLRMGISAAEYGDYVRALSADHPHLKPLQKFIDSPRPLHCQEDQVTVFDVSSGGILSKVEEFQTVGDEINGGNALAAKIDHVSHDLDTRIITVTHLTPTTAMVLGARYDLSADFFNAHLPGSMTHPSRSFAAGSASTFHVDFAETYCIDNFTEMPILLTERDPGYKPSAVVVWQILRHSVRRCYYETSSFVHALSNQDHENNEAWFTQYRRVSIQTITENSVHIVLIFQYPSPALGAFNSSDGDGTNWIPGKTRARIGPMPTPSKWQLSESTSKLDVPANSPGKSSMTTHLRCILDEVLPRCERAPEEAIQSVFDSIRYALISTTTQLSQRIGELSSMHKMTSTAEEDRDHSFHLTAIANQAQKIRFSVQDALEQLERFPVYEPGGNDNRSDPDFPAPSINEYQAFGSGSNLMKSQDRESRVPFGTSSHTDALAPSDREWRRLKLQFQKTLDIVDHLADNSRQLLQTKLVYMQIAESRKAIQQTDSVRRLTMLAFIFIPLTYVASVFGADIIDMDERKTGRNFAISSVVTAVGTILLAWSLGGVLPALKAGLNSLKTHVYSVLAAVDPAEKTFNVWESLFLWRTYYWGSWNLADWHKNWLLLPLAILDLMRLRLRQAWKKYRSRNNVSSKQSGEA